LSLKRTVFEIFDF